MEISLLISHLLLYIALPYCGTFHVLPRNLPIDLQEPCKLARLHNLKDLPKHKFLLRKLIKSFKVLLIQHWNANQKRKKQHNKHRPEETITVSCNLDNFQTQRIKLSTKLRYICLLSLLFNLSNNQNQVSAAITPTTSNLSSTINFKPKQKYDQTNSEIYIHIPLISNKLCLYTRKHP